MTLNGEEKNDTSILLTRDERSREERRAEAAGQIGEIVKEIKVIACIPLLYV